MPTRLLPGEGRADREGERQRRRSARLTPRQAYYLDAWGYPYVLDEFRPHFTLTNAILDADLVARLLEWEFRRRVAWHALRVDTLTLFAESEPGGEFQDFAPLPAPACEACWTAAVSSPGAGLCRLSFLRAAQGF